MNQKPTSPTLQSKIAALDVAVEWFYSDEFNLDEATARYEAAFALSKDIEKSLLNLKNHIEVLPEDFTKS